jgi:hypothetical protein
MCSDFSVERSGLQLLLGLASAVFLGSESHGTHDHILLSRIWDSSNLEGQVPMFISSRIRVSQLYPQALGSVCFDSLKMGVHQEIHVSCHRSKYSKHSLIRLQFIPILDTSLIISFIRITYLITFSTCLCSATLYSSTTTIFFRNTHYSLIQTSGIQPFFFIHPQM